MNRIQKKCVIASAGFHVLLLVILFVGPAFLSPPTKETQYIEIVPMILTDKDVSPSGGNPNAKPPAPLPPSQPQQPKLQQAPAPKPPQRIEPVEKQEPVKTDKTDPNALDDKKPHKIVPNKTLVKRSDVKPTKPSTPTKPSNSTDTNDRSRAFQSAAKRILKGTSPSTEIEPVGPGGGGPTYANYAAWVKTVYTDAWLAPDDVNDDEATTKVSVTIARDGTVLSAQIIQSSGNPAVDRSVKATLDRVRTIGKSFPEGVKEEQRTYKIDFNLKAKQLLG